MIINLYKHRGYIWRTALSEVRNRYAGAGLGVVWNFVQPLAMILIYSVVFTKIIATDRSNSLHAPYTIYLCAAMLPWAAFGECLNRCTNAFVANALYLRKLPIPEQVFVAQAALTSAMNLVLAFALLVIVAVCLGHPPTWYWLLLPVPMTFLIGLGFGVGLLLGTLNAFIRDIGQMVPIALQIGFWSYPIVYTSNMLPKPLQVALPFNPIYPAMESIRLLFIDGVMPGPGLWAGMVAWTAAAGLAGYAVLRKLRRELRDVI